MTLTHFMKQNVQDTCENTKWKQSIKLTGEGNYLVKFGIV